MRAEAGVRPLRRGRTSRFGRGSLRLARRGWKAALWTLGALAAALLAVGVVFAGSPERIAGGLSLGGVPLGGLTGEAARAKLAARAAAVEETPVVFTAGGERLALTPGDLDVRVDWRGAVEKALAAGDGPVPFRGLVRLKLRFFGADLEPNASFFAAGLRHRVEQLAARVDVPAREASIVLRGLEPVVVPPEAGRELDRERAAPAIVTALAGFEREPVALPVEVGEPNVTAQELAPVAEQVRTALSAPVRFGYKDAHWPLRPAYLARLLLLPAGGRSELAVGGPEAERYFADLGRGVARKPRDADFRIAASGRVRVVPSQEGRAIDGEATGEALLGAMLSTTERQADLVARTVAPELTTERLRSLGVTRVLSTYGSPYSGSSDRIRNLQLAVAALEGTLVAPGAEFSFNEEVGPRTEERGYGPAPVIIDGEYEEGVGGGVSQVATTIFNAVWEAGLKITGRTAHALYIERYPLGRDATVNYPNVDLRFRNDTDKWIFLRATYGDTGISISLLGAPTKRRVVSVPGELREVGPADVEREPDPTMYVGERVVEDMGQPARTVTVTRTVYVGDEVLYREAWTTNYRSEDRIVRVGTKPRPAEKPKPKPPPPTTTGTGTGTTTTPTTTGGY